MTNPALIARGERADAGTCGHEIFRTDRRQPRIDQSKMNAREDRWHCGRQIDQENELPTIEPKDLADFDDLSGGEANAFDDIENHRNSRRERNENDLCRFIKAEPDRNQRNPRKQSDLLKAVEPPCEDSVGNTRKTKQQHDRNAQSCSDRKPREIPPKAHHQIRQQFSVGQFAPSRCADLLQRRKKLRIEKP